MFLERERTAKFGLNVLLCMVLLFSFTGSVFAAHDVEKVETKLESKIEKIQKKLDKLNKQYEGEVLVAVDMSKATEEAVAKFDTYTDEDLEDYLTSLFEDTKKITYKVNMKPEDVPANPNKINKMSKFGLHAPGLTSKFAESNTTYNNRAADVNFSVPALGMCSVKIRYNVTMDSNKYFVSGEITNSLLNSGACVGGWAHDYGNFIVSYYRTYAELYAYGVLSYGIGIFTVHSNQSVYYLDSWTNY